MERYKRASNNDQQDQYVLTVFLPLLAIAILACIGGCCYMERRRRRRKKRNGGIDPEELRQQQDFDDTASVISTSSSRRRHYLDPTPTTGRLVRGAAVRSNYSTVGEPLYEVEKRRRGSTRNKFADYGLEQTRSAQSDFGDMTQQRPSSRHRGGYGERPLSRSHSMLDVRYGKDEEDGNLRRTRSSNNLSRYRNSFADSGYQENQNNDSDTENMYEFLNAKSGQELDEKPQYRYNRPPSPSQSEWSVRTAPPQSREDEHMSSIHARPSSRPSSMVDFPLRNPARLTPSNRTPSLMRSLSQPNLNAVESKTYPQGILKKVPANEDRRLPGMQYQASTDSGIKDVYGEVGDYSGRASRMRHHTTPNAMEDTSNARPSSRPPSVMSYGSRRQNYDPYFTPRYGNYQNGYHHQSYGYSQPPAYSASNYHHHQLPTTDKYAHSYDPYGGYGDYWGQQTQHRHRMSMY